MANLTAAGASGGLKIKMFAGQDFGVLRDRSRTRGVLFEDDKFPRNIPGVEWKRPPEFMSNPKFIENGAGTSDVCQGELGNCWLLSSMTSLTSNPKLFSRVVPEKQTFSKSEGYTGIFQFQLSQFGEFADVIIDDLLPTKNNALMYAKSSTKEEMWSPLLEKAYAKTRGGYSALEGGTIPEALEDFTGGLAETVSLTHHTSEEVWDLIVESLHSAFPMACYIEVSGHGKVGEVKEDGLVLGHAYSILGAKEVKKDSGDVTLIRLRNPWGFTEYNGPWSDKSPEWKSVSEEDQKKLNLKKEDGEFWMLCEDFCSLFSWMVICHTNLDSPDCDVTHLRGRWQRGVNAGGGRRLRTFFNNPQFRLRVGGSSDKEAGHTNKQGERWRVLLELMQTDSGAEKLHIACHLYQVPQDLVPSPKLDRKFFTRNRPVCDTGEPKNSRGVTMRACLPAGEYVIVPSTFDANQEGNFYIRVCCKKEAGGSAI
ncbi:calpain-1 catalytic subunit-like [Rana temporaria]|uniref:calpain-1 catalytic subunit-like n=1 Tax=Rana temporaria TaxID=8407 RepID=UPI001AAD680B|nr:calpain-1 catalytic subunit-like [Rana temporaria]